MLEVLLERLEAGDLTTKAGLGRETISQRTVLVSAADEHGVILRLRSRNGWGAPIAYHWNAIAWIALGETDGEE